MTDEAISQPPSVRISLRDSSKGYNVTPSRVPLSLLREFSKDVDDFLKGDDGEISTGKIEVAVVEGSFAIELRDSLVAPRFFHDLAGLVDSQILDLIDKKRSAIIDKWQKRAKSTRDVSYRIDANKLKRPITISATTDFHLDDADNWVRVERYVNGEIEDLGGASKSNAHLRLPNGNLVRVEATKDLLRDEKINRLYKQSMIRFRADFNIVTHEYRNAVLIEFVDYSPTFDEAAFERMTQRGRAAWKDVEKPGEWVDNLRGTN